MFNRMRAPFAASAFKIIRMLKRFNNVLATVFIEDGLQKFMISTKRVVPQIVRTIVDQRVNSAFCTVSFLANVADSYEEALAKYQDKKQFSSGVATVFVENGAYRVMLPNRELLPYLIQSVSVPEDSFVTVTVYCQCNVAASKKEALANYKQPV